MSDAKRVQLSRTIARVVPSILQGVHLDFLAGQSITYTQFLVLVAVYSHERCTMNTLAKNMHVSMPTTTGIIGRLVTGGYVRRSKGPKDRRQVMVELSAKGRTFIAKFQEVVSRRWLEVLTFFGPKDLEIFEQALKKVEANLRSGQAEL